MAKVKFMKGQALFALARKKATELGVDAKNLKLAELIHKVQIKEGHTACFRNSAECPELDCCWQASCGAKMIGS
ncbi:MAG: SAP domain-containing protein [Desulfobulbaceae bacterium]|nr:MAG: SAP domain-containing protein [Desulfobulbaceae bacterium]